MPAAFEAVGVHEAGGAVEFPRSKVSPCDVRAHDEHAEPVEGENVTLVICERRSTSSAHAPPDGAGFEPRRRSGSGAVARRRSMNARPRNAPAARAPRLPATDGVVDSPASPVGARSCGERSECLRGTGTAWHSRITPFAASVGASLVRSDRAFGARPQKEHSTQLALTTGGIRRRGSKGDRQEPL
jgi:hypothetical protein